MSFKHLLAAVAFVLAAPNVWAQQAVRVGLVGPFTGGTSDLGSSMRFGAELAVKEINEFGGYLGRPLELVQRDDKSVPEEGRKMAEDLVLKERVAFTIGYCNTGVAMKSLDVFQTHRHLLMVPCSQGTALTRKYPPRDSMIFRVAPYDALNSAFLIQEIVDRRKLTRVAILADVTGYGEGGLNDLTQQLAQRNLKPVYVARFPLGVQSLVEQMKAARDAGADAVVCYTVGPEEAVAVRARLEAGVKAPFFAPWTLSGRNAMEKAGPEALEGTMMVQTIIHDTLNERRTSFLARYFKYSKEKNIGSLMAAAQAYDAVHLMLRAMFKTKGDTSGEALKRALEDLPQPYQGVVTTYRKPFDPDDHDAIAINMLWLGVWRKGQIEYHSPEDAKRAGFVRQKEKSPTAPPPRS
jgi:branched-chain amino acid transport system substrate-binding protein